MLEENAITERNLWFNVHKLWLHNLTETIL